MYFPFGFCRYELNGENHEDNRGGKTISKRSEQKSVCSCQDHEEEDVDLDLAEVEAAEAEEDDAQCSLVTVLASDGYTCITSPVISNRSDDSNGKQTTTTIRCSGVDSGLSSEDGSDARHLSSSSSSSHDEIKNGGSSAAGSDPEDNLTLNKKQDILNESTDDMGTYAERNVLHEEATTVQAETITVDRFRQRFCPGSPPVTGSASCLDTGSRGSLVSGSTSFDSHMTANNNLGGVSRYKAPPPPPRQRRTSSSSSNIKVS